MLERGRGKGEKEREERRRVIKCRVPSGKSSYYFHLNQYAKLKQ